MLYGVPPFASRLGLSGLELYLLEDPRIERISFSLGSVFLTEWAGRCTLGRVDRGKAGRLASRFEVSEDVFQQEVGLLRARRRWIGEERERVMSRLEGLGNGLPDPKALEMLASRLRER